MPHPPLHGRVLGGTVSRALVVLLALVLLAPALPGCNPPPLCPPTAGGLIDALAGNCRAWSTTTTQAWTCTASDDDDPCTACARAQCCDASGVCLDGGTCDESAACLADHCAKECPQ